MASIFQNSIGNLMRVHRSSSLTGGLSSFFPASQTEAAKKVNTNSSLTISAFYGALNTIANSMALLPMSVYIRSDKKRLHYKEHPVDYLIYKEPNQYMTAFVFKFIMTVAVYMRGNAYALIVRNNAGNVISYQYLNPDNVSVIESDGALYYRFKDQTFSSDEIIHVPGFSFDGIVGKSVIQFAADNLGVTLNAQKFGSDSLQDRGISHGVLESDMSIKNDKKKEISKAFSTIMASGDKHRAPLLDEGLKYKQISLNPEEAQFIQTYASGVEDIARWFNIPAHKLAIKGEGGYNYLENMEIDYLHRAVMPMGEKFKQEFERKTFTVTERREGIYIFLNYAKLLQVNPKARAEFYKSLYYMGAKSANEIRELEDDNPREDPGGDEYMQMSNLINPRQMEKILDGTLKQPSNQNKVSDE